MSDEPGLGDRIRELRKRRGLTQRELAGLSGVSLSLVRKLEQGERDDTRAETLRKLAGALAVPTTALLSTRPPNDPLPAGSVYESLRRALTQPAAGGELEPVTDAGVSDALGAAVRLYHGNRYYDLALVLPELVRDSRSASPLLRSRVLQLTGSLLVQTRQRDVAQIALAESLAQAEASGSVLDAASAVITLCWLLLVEQQFDQVRSLATRWADQIEPKLSTATRPHISAWGWLLLRASAAAIRDNRPGEAVEAMRLAGAAAAAVGPDRGSYHTYWTTFGPATVAMKRVENAIIDGRPDHALHLAESVPAGLRPTSDNRNRHLLDISAAHLALRDHARAFDVLWQLSRQAPAWLAHQRAAQDQLGQILTRRRALTSQMRDLADFLRVRS